jgi:hypothetical protein
MTAKHEKEGNNMSMSSRRSRIILALDYGLTTASIET